MKRLCVEDHLPLGAMLHAPDSSPSSRQCGLTGGLLHQDVRALFLDAIRAVHKHQLWQVAQHAFLWHQAEGSDDRQVSHRGPARGRAVDRDDAAAALATNGVGHEALATVDISDMHLLVLNEIRSIKQVFVDRARPFAMQFAIGDSGAMDLGFEQCSKHVHYRWPGWLTRMADARLVRSMSHKGYSPDNAACEGFFGRLKTELSSPHNWQSTTIEQFIRAVDFYIRWCNEQRIKISLGSLSPLEYRQRLGFVA